MGFTIIAALTVLAAATAAIGINTARGTGLELARLTFGLDEQ